MCHTLAKGNGCMLHLSSGLIKYGAPLHPIFFLYSPITIQHFPPPLTSVVAHARSFFYQKPSTCIYRLPNICSIRDTIPDNAFKFSYLFLEWQTCWSFKIVTNRINSSKSATAAESVPLVHCTDMEVSEQTFGCQ